MADVLRFTTLRVGIATLTVHGQVIEQDVRVLRASDGSYRWLGPTLSEPASTLEAAVAAAEAPPESSTEVSDISREVQWRDAITTFNRGEAPCPICGAPAPASPRYPRRLCPACVLEATDAQGRLLRFSNESMSGGFEARYADTGARHDSHDCFVRGLRCRADEARFGGIVVQAAGE